MKHTHYDFKNVKPVEEVETDQKFFHLMTKSGAAQETPQDEIDQKNAEQVEQLKQELDL